MDCEGAEIEILLHDREVLDKCILIIAELHAVTYCGVSYGVEDMIIEQHGFVLRARRGPVCVFERKNLIGDDHENSK